MPRRVTLRTWEQVEAALQEHGVMKVQVARYYGFPKQALNNAMREAKAVTLPNSDAIWTAIDGITTARTEGE